MIKQAMIYLLKPNCVSKRLTVK